MPHILVLTRMISLHDTQVQVHPRNPLGMYAWVLGSRFCRMVAGNRCVHADGKKDGVGLLWATKRLILV